jgi:serine/threonine protein kinase
LTLEVARSHNPAVAKVAAEVGSTANRYQILGRLAAGGMAEIFLARGASVAGVERYCVLKRILRERAGDAQFARMFLDEARLAAQLQHPNIASVYDIGMLGDSYFFTMEYVHGETLRSIAQRADELRRPVPLACVLTIIAGAAAGLHHAHERNANDGSPLGIVHRDVSPANVMVSFEGNVKIVDFGVAKADNRAVETQSGTVKGKISYLSPEQCRAARVDRRSDLFSLGIVMWEMLTGTRLYQRASDFESMTAIANEPPPPPSSRRREIPRTVDDIVLRLLAKSVTTRFQTAAEVVEAIEDASMRARTILSTSAVSRLVRDLFGVRAEPWLQLDGNALPHELVTFTTGPVPADLGRGPLNGADAVLASVPDLHSLTGDTQSISVAPELESPSEAESTDRSVLEPAASPSPAPVISRRATYAASAVASPSPQPIMTHESPPFDAARVPNTTLLGAGPPPPSSAVPYSTMFATPSRLLAQVAPPARTAIASAAIPVIADLRPPTYEPTGSQPRLAQYESGETSSILAATQRRSDRPSTSSITWRLIAVIILAAAIGVVTVWLLMRAPPAPPPAAGSTLGSVPPPAAGAESVTASGTPGAAGPEPVDLTPGDVAAGSGEAILPDPGGDEGAGSASPATPESLSPGADAGAARPSPKPTSPRPTSIRPPSRAKDLPLQLPLPSPPMGEPMAAWLDELAHRGDHATVVRVCSGTKLIAEIASVCVLAACHEHDIAKATAWLPAVPIPRRDTVVARCPELDADRGERARATHAPAGSR